VLRRVDPKGFSALRRYGGDEFLTRLAALGVKWEDMALLFHRLERSGLFHQYPRMQGFIELMVRTTPDAVLFKGEHLLSLQGRVTLNLKKAALRLQHGPPKYLETVRNHLRAALAEHSSLSRLPGEQELIHLGHITANGVDRVYRLGNYIDVLEVKSSSRLGLHDLANWLIKAVEPKTGKATYTFNGERLNTYLERNGFTLQKLLNAGYELRFNLFIYDENPHLAPELLELFKSGTRKISIAGGIGAAENAEITLVRTLHWD
jgi:hypothetical protein